MWGPFDEWEPSALVSFTAPTGYLSGQTHSAQETPCGLIQARALMLLPLFCCEGERALSGCGRRIAKGGRGKAEEEGLRVEVKSRRSQSFL